MERSLLDTDVFSEILRGRDLAVRRTAEAYLRSNGRFTLSVVSVTEIVDGLWRQRLEAHLSRLLEQLEVERHEIIPLDFPAAKLAGMIAGDLHRTGQPVGRADPLIAAIALQAQLPLVTGNTKHFARIQDLGYPLQLANWRETPS